MPVVAGRPRASQAPGRALARSSHRAASESSIIAPATAHSSKQQSEPWLLLVVRSERDATLDRRACIHAKDGMSGPSFPACRERGVRRAFPAASVRRLRHDGVRGARSASSADHGRSGLTRRRARSRGHGSLRETARACVASCRGSPDGNSRWRLRRRIGGRSWPNPPSPSIPYSLSSGPCELRTMGSRCMSRWSFRHWTPSTRRNAR